MRRSELYPGGSLVLARCRVVAGAAGLDSTRSSACRTEVTVMLARAGTGRSGRKKLTFQARRGVVRLFRAPEEGIGRSRPGLRPPVYLRTSARLTSTVSSSAPAA